LIINSFFAKDGEAMLNKIKSYMIQNKLLTKGDRIIVGVSGGADSICLLYVLLSLRREYELILTAVHINHGIRGKEADLDEQFVKEFCSIYGIKCESYRYEVKRLAMENGLSEEEAGRRVRYQSFFECCRKYKCNKLAVAHNKNDNAETVLFHLFRGSGIRGLSGIAPDRKISGEMGEITIIRPLLGVTRREIEAFLAEEGINYRIDSTNLTDDYTRNKIRNQILTYACNEINAQAISNISEAAVSLREIDDYLNQNIRICYKAIVRKEEFCYRINADALRQEHIVIQKGIIMQLLQELAGSSKDLEEKHVQAVLRLLQKKVGSQVHLPYDMIAEREYNDISVYRRCKGQAERYEQQAFRAMYINIPGLTYVITRNLIIETELIPYKKSTPIPKSSCMKWFDYDKIENAVEIRTRKEGDLIQINSLGGHKKLKDYFIDRKLPQKERDNQLLIADGNHIMWIPGVIDRMSEKYKVEASTTKILLMKMIDMEEK
jgi:tRNA(Ile)-lysidine synthase